MNITKVYVQLLIGFLLIWCFVESTAGASLNMQKHETNELNGLEEIGIKQRMTPEVTTVTPAALHIPVVVEADVKINGDVFVDIDEVMKQLIDYIMYYMSNVMYSENIK